MENTSYLLEDLESGSPCPGPSESEIENTAINTILGESAKENIELMDVYQTQKSEVDSRTESKSSENIITENVPSRANTDTTVEKPNVPDLLNIEAKKCTSEIDSDTEFKLQYHSSTTTSSDPEVSDSFEPIYKLRIYYENNEWKSTIVGRSDTVTAVADKPPKVVPQRGRGSAKKNSMPRANLADKRSTALKRPLDTTGIDESERKSKKAKKAKKSAEEEKEIKGGRSSRGKDIQSCASTEPGSSGCRSNKSPLPPSPPLSLVSEMNDSSDSSDKSAIEEISGVQPELQSTPKDSEIYKHSLAEYFGIDPMQGFDDLLGPMPRKSDIFKGFHVILTCTIPIKESRNIETRFGTYPFFKEHLRRQIEAGGGIVYPFFENIPKTKYNDCKLIAHHPCTTAKYVQCLAANIMPISHEWIIDCCTNDEYVDFEQYVLPSGWSIIDDEYKEWNLRQSAQPLKDTVVLIASFDEKFSKFWQRVCKLAGSVIRVVKSLDDVTNSTKGIMLTDEDFDENIKLKAEHFKIPVVSTVWIVQSLIGGYACDPELHKKFKQE